MDREFLDDYSAKDKEEEDKFLKKLREGKLGLDDEHPLLKRLKLNEPYTQAIPMEKIWYQIPFYGTTVVSIPPIKEEFFERAHGFNIEDIERLIEFAEETGRIQFALGTDPLRYEGFDFLDPILDMRPPILSYLPLYELVSSKERDIWESEFSYFATGNQKFRDVFGNLFADFSSAMGYKTSIENDLVKFSRKYCQLRTLGYNEIADEIMVQLTNDPIKAVILLTLSGDLIIDQYSSVLYSAVGGIKSYPSYFKTLIHPEMEVDFSCEVGKFLNDKLKLIIPKSIDGAIELNEEYDLYDLRKVMDALNEAVRKEKVDTINAKSEELFTIFDNVWTEANKIKRKIDIAKHGISLGIGVIGTVATMPIVGIGGLLAGLGFSIGGEIAVPKISESLAEKIMKGTTSSRMIHIYDFKNKYSIIK
jgi:hypothetical protein